MANLTYTVANKNGSYDGDTVVKQYNSVTINTPNIVRPLVATYLFRLNNQI